MKTLEKFCLKNKLKLAKVKYEFKNYTWYGWDIINPKNNQIIMAFEPNVASKWYIRYAYTTYKGERHLKRITLKFLESLDLNAKSNYTNNCT